MQKFHRLPAVQKWPTVSGLLRYIYQRRPLPVFETMTSSYRITLSLSLSLSLAHTHFLPFQMTLEKSLCTSRDDYQAISKPQKGRWMIKITPLLWRKNAEGFLWPLGSSYIRPTVEADKEIRKRIFSSAAGGDDGTQNRKKALLGHNRRDNTDCTLEVGDGSSM